MKNGIYEFGYEVCRMGIIEYLGIMSDEDAKSMVGKRIYLDDCLGKHSEIDITFEDGDFKLITDDEKFVALAKSYFPSGLMSGYDLPEIARDLEEEGKYE